MPAQLRIAQAPQPVLAALQAAVAVVGGERVAAGGDEGQHRVEIGAGEIGEGRRVADLVVERIGVERAGAGDPGEVLRQDVEAAREELAAVERVLVQRVLGGDALQHLEPVGRDQGGAARLVEAVVGAADPLQQAGGTLGRADLDDEVDVAPVDAEVERGGADHGAQGTGSHRGLDLAALLDGEAAVMQADWQVRSV